MSKIYDLIKELCPDGVEFKKLGTICKIETGKLNANASCEDGKYPFFTTAKEISRIDTYRWDTEALLIAGNANVGDVKYFKGKFEAYQRTYVLTDFVGLIDIRFLFFCLSNNLKQYLASRKNDAAMTYIVLGTLQNFPIPVPPLEVQREIVRVLDSFTELEARKKQYEYYCNTLLTFGDGVVWKPMGEVGELIRGNGLQKKDFTEEGFPCIHYGQIYTYYGTFAKETKSFVSCSLAEKLVKAECGDVIITNTSENINDVGKAVAWCGRQAVATGGHATVFKPKLVSGKYFAYYSQTGNFYKEKKRYAKGTKVIDVSTKDMSKIKIPVPSLEKQKQIVSILDKFEKLTNDISVGLPAEIEARRKQYEYYRNKLLTFKELECSR